MASKHGLRDEFSRALLITVWYTTVLIGHSIPLSYPTFEKLPSVGVHASDLTTCRRGMDGDVYASHA